MPTPPLEEPTTKSTINLFTKDVEWLKRHEDHWTSAIRELVRKYVFAKQHGSDFIEVS